MAMYSAKGISAAYFTEDSTENMKERVRREEYQLVYVTLCSFMLLCTEVAMYSAKGISAAYFTENSTENMKEGVHREEYQLVYVTPELPICNAGWRKVWLSYGFSGSATKHPPDT